MIHIQSKSDVITNSSSTVFVMSDGDKFVDYYDHENFPGFSECTYYYKITWDELNPYSKSGASDLSYELEMIAQVFNLPDILELADEKHYGNFSDTFLVANDFTNEYIVEHKDDIQKILDKKNLYWVEIEDYFTDCEAVYDDAENQCIWMDYRH